MLPDAVGLAADDDGDVVDAGTLQRVDLPFDSVMPPTRTRHFGLSPAVPFSRDPLPAARMIPFIDLRLTGCAGWRLRRPDQLPMLARV